MRFNYSNSSVFNISYHLIFVTKYRYPLLFGKENYLIEIFNNISIRYNFIIKYIEIMPDHIHLFIKFKFVHTNLIDIIKYLKGISSYKLRHKYKELNKVKSL